MSFDIARTPTLQAVAIQDERRLARDLQQRVEESIASAETEPSVVDAAAAHQAAELRFSNLRKAERTLSQHAKDLRELAVLNSRIAIEALVESAAAGEKPDFKKMQGLAATESQSAFVSRAIQRIVEHLIPLGKIAALRAESHAAMARARVIETIAQERAEKVLEQMRDAVTEEMVLPVDLSKGVSGALLAHAAGLKQMAVQISESADQMERSYGERKGQ